MTCDGVRELLPLFAGRDLDGTQMAHVQSHVEGCEACTRELAAYRECAAVLQELRDPEIPDVSRDLWENVRRGVFGARAPGRAAAMFAFKAVAAVLIGMCVGFTGATLLRDRVQSSAPQAKVEPSAPAPVSPPVIAPAAPAGGQPRYSYWSADYRKEVRDLQRKVEELQRRLAELERQQKQK